VISSKIQKQGSFWALRKKTQKTNKTTWSLRASRAYQKHATLTGDLFFLI
jgi:hypothetical protein